MEEQKDILQRSDDPLSVDPVADGHLSAAVPYSRRSLLIHSLVLAVTIPALLWYSGGDMLLAGWSLSLFAVTYLFHCICLFSNAATPLAKLFVALSYAGLFAFFVGTLLSSKLGMAIMYLESVVAAGLFGATLAQHRQSDGTETAALVAVATARATNKKPNPSNRKAVYRILGFMALCYAPRFVWLLVVDSPARDVAIGMFGLIGFLQFFHISCVVGSLNGAVFTDDSSVWVIMYFAFVAILFITSCILGGEVVGVTVLWVCILASTAFLGYYHHVHASYEEIMSWRYVCGSLITDKFEVCFSVDR
jgi:hypothetical protein